MNALADHRSALTSFRPESIQGELQMSKIKPLPIPTKQASKYLLENFNVSCSPGTLAKYRVQGIGPVYRKIGGAVFYDIEELIRWVNWRTHIRQSTSDIYPAKYEEPPQDYDVDIFEMFGHPSVLKGQSISPQTQQPS